MVSVSLCFALVLLAVGSDATKWKQCGGQDYVLMNKLDISPMPMKFPGKSTFTLDATIKQVLNGSDSTITIKRSTFLGYIRIPCIFEVGSWCLLSENKENCQLLVLRDLKRLESQIWAPGFEYQKKKDLASSIDSTYKDTCSLPKRMMSENWGGIMGPIVTQVMDYFGKAGAKLDCPLPKQNVLLDKVDLKLPTIPTYMTFLASGDYQVQLMNKDKRDGKTILCIEMDFSIA